MATKPVIIDFSTKYCADIMQPLFDMVWDGLGESPVPVDVRTHIDAAPTIHTHDHLTELVNTGLPDCHPTSAITGLDTALAGKVESVVAGAHIDVDSIDPLNPVVSAKDFVETIVEGNNITVDATDPLNPIVSAAGVSGIAHNDLADRDVADTHPVDAITGLETALNDAKAGRKNLLINGNFLIAQRGHKNTNDAQTVGYIAADRWACYVSSDLLSGIGGTGTSAGEAGVSEINGGHGYFVSFQTHEVGLESYYLLSQSVEGYNIRQLKWGTADAKPITISFMANSTQGGTFHINIRNGDVDRSYVAPFTVPGGDVKTRIEITVPGDTTGVWGDINNAGIIVGFAASVGVLYWTNAPETWVNGNKLGTNLSTNLGANVGDTLRVADVQVEAGDKATDFEYRLYPNELALCQRYFQTAPRELVGYAQSTTNIVGSASLPVVLRTAPTITKNRTTISAESPWYQVARTSSGAISAHPHQTSVAISLEGFSGLAAGTISMLYGDQFDLDAEL